MYLCLIAFLVVAATATVCPYGRAEKRSPCAYMNANSNSKSLTRALPATGKKGVFFMTRNGPVSSELYVANADGSNARSLLGNNTVFELDAQWAPDGEWIILTSERNGDGNPDLWRVRPDGSGLEEVAATPAVETAGSISPDGNLVAYQGTLNNLKSNIWIQELSTGNSWNVTNSTSVAGNSSLPDGHFRPAWSPNGEWLVFSSDKNTQWRGHNGTRGWEHTQENSIYTIRLDGTGYRRIVNKTGYSLNSPKFSPDGTRIVYYEIETEDTFYARLTPHVDQITSQIVSVDFATGDNRIEHTSSSGVKIFPQYVTADTIGYLHKGSGIAGTVQGLNYTSATLGGNTSFSPVLGAMRSPSWSPNGTLVLHQVMSNTPNRAQDKIMYSWQEDWEYRYSDILPRLNSENILALTTQKTGNASIVTMEPDATDQNVAFSDITNSSIVPEVAAVDSLFGAYQPSWSPDNQFIATGWGNWFQGRDVGCGVIVRTSANGSSYEVLTNNSVLNLGFPSYAPDGKSLVYRQWDWDGPLGLRILNMTDLSLRVLTTGWDNLPGWSADGSTILFTRRTSPVIEGPYDDNYDVCTIKPDGSDFRVLTTSLATDAHTVWSYDGKILYSTGEFGFQDEGSIYDFNFQPYAQIMSMEADGSNKLPLTNGMWEDGMPLFVPNTD